MRLACVLILAFSGVIADGDILTLRDGSRHYGSLISQSDAEVVFRVTLADGKSSTVRRFRAETVARVERSAPPDVPAAPPPVEATDAPDQALLDQTLRESFELLDDGDLDAALRAMQSAVVRASPAALRQLEVRTRALRGVALDELLADTRLRATLPDDAGRPGTFTLRFATPYESAALGRQLESRQTEALRRVYADRSIEEWAAHRAEYTELRPDAQRMVADARLAAAIIAARAKFDPRSKDDRAARKRLLDLRDDLTRFISAVTALPGYTAPQSALPPDPGAETLERLKQQAASQPASRPASRPADPPRRESDLDQPPAQEHP